MSELESLSREQIVGRFTKCLSIFFTQFTENPFSFFYEEDARAHLLVDLEKSIDAISEFPVDNQFKASIASPVTSSIVKGEYPNGYGGRFDIAVLLPNLAHSFYAVPASIGVEIKLGSEYIKSFSKCGGFKDDFSNLKLYHGTIEITERRNKWEKNN